MTIYTITLNPSIDRTLAVDEFHVGGTFKATSSDVLPAGKGINVARVVATLGESVVALGFVGESDVPAFARVLAEGRIENHLTSVPGSTRVSVTILDPVQQTETHVREQGGAPPEQALYSVEAELAHVTPADWVVLAGSLPPGLPVDTYCGLVRKCSSRGASTLLDASGPPLLAGVRGLPTILKLNLFELMQVDSGSTLGAEGAGGGQASVLEVLQVARRIQARGISVVIVSMGKRGALGLDPGGRAWHAQVVLDVPVVDAVGSGDAFGAGCVVAMARGVPFPDALRLGVACGAANTLLAGAGRCRRSDIERLQVRATCRELSGAR